MEDHEGEFFFAAMNGWLGVFAFIARFVFGQYRIGVQERQMNRLTKTCSSCHRLLGKSSRICPRCETRYLIDYGQINHSED